MTGGSGVTISEYTVTVDSGVTQTVSHDDSGGVFTATIIVPEYYNVSATAINSCGLSSRPATTTVFIEARGLWNLLGVLLAICHKCLTDQPSQDPVCYCNGSMSEGAIWKVDLYLEIIICNLLVLWSG